MVDTPIDAVGTLPARGATVAPRRRTLLVLIGDEIRAHPLPATGSITLGRGTDVELRVDEPSLSRRHVRLDLSDDAVTATDLRSANGTSLRGVRIPVGVRVEIAVNEPIAIGDVVLVVQELRPPTGATIAAPRPSGRVDVRVASPIVLDPEMRRLCEVATRVARGTISVLLTGESGAGKEVLAELVHAASPRARGPLVRIHCAALADTLVEAELFGHERGAFTGAERERIGLLEAADGGTAFLDEIGEVPLPVQAKLLRVVEEGRLVRVGASTPRAIDVRFVAATNRDLEAAAAAGAFRRDLFFRIAGVVLSIPPLRARLDEIEPLARRFAAETARGLGRTPPAFSGDAIAALRAHDWPGNVRELRNVVERAVLLADAGALEPRHLALAPPRATAAPLAGELDALERRRILDALDRTGGNQTRAAALLGMPRRTFVKRLDAYGVPRPRRR